MGNRYIIGIDLGTTNSAVTYMDASNAGKGETPPVKVFRVPQLTAPGEISRIKVLPSFLYLPGEHELPKEEIMSPRPSQAPYIVGAFARDQGVKVPGRMIASAKSWLCHGKVDRKAAILPWGTDDGIEKMSPVAVSTAYLRHIRDTWNHLNQDHEDRFLEKQTVVITVPASFDEVARDLTVEAASKAGLSHAILLEEPLAAFYSWLCAHEQDWSDAVRPGELVLVCDVGGGTTDFTLITLRERDGNPVFERIAVGDHLILGGDNMDLALGHLCETRFHGDKKGRLNMDRWQSLCSQCRRAKENILSDLSESETVTLVGEGRKLIADTLSARLSRHDVEALILDGFFPMIEPGKCVSEVPRSGMTEFGLPYAQDPAITRHLIRFLENHRDDVAQILRRETPMPDLILFNGAALNPPRIQERIRAAIARWFAGEKGGPRVLLNPALDLAVASGAAYYGLVRKGHGVRVDSGSPRAYYLGVHLGGNSAETGRGDAGVPETALCLVERHMAEGTRHALTDKKFDVLANQPVRFYLYSSSYRTGDRVGDVVTIDDTLSPMPPLQTVIKFGKRAGDITIPVHVEADYTELGTLGLWCRSVGTPHRWRFQFQLRGTDDTPEVPGSETLEESLMDEATAKVKKAFSVHEGKGEIARLSKGLAETVGQTKEEWPLGFIRRIADELMAVSSARRKSLEYEVRWLNLMGFCMRPGFGDTLDAHRIEGLWKIFSKGPVHTRNVQVRSEWWVLWRRVAGGLSVSQQRQVSQEISSLLKPKKGGKKPSLPPQEHMEIWMALANLERLSPGDKAAWGRLLLKSLNPKKIRPQYWWSLSRIGAREPLYGSIDRIVPPDVVIPWIEKILATEWKNPRPVGAAVAQMARRTGDRKRDLNPETVHRIIEWLAPHEWSVSHIEPLKEVVPIARHEENLIFGESLPSGICLRME